MNKIRFLIDRIIKKINEPQVYLDSDLNFSLFGGIDVINGWAPITTYTINMFPDMLLPFLQFAGAWYALNSQFMLEADLAFSYTGQAVSLDYDRTGPIESEIGRLQDYLTEHLPKAKTSVLRTSSGGMSGLGRLGVTTSGIGPTGMYIHRRQYLIRSIG